MVSFMVQYDLENAVQIAEEFLKDRHSTMNLESSSLKNNIWCIIFDIGFLSRHLKEMQIDANSGKIIRYANIDTVNNPV